MDRHGCQDPSDHCLSRGRSQPQECREAVGQDSNKRTVTTPRFIRISMWSMTGVIPAAQHQAIGKLARKTNHIERFNNTLRQRVSRLVRNALSFSKKLANHIGAIKLFHLPLQPDESCGIERALHGYHYPPSEAHQPTAKSGGMWAMPLQAPPKALGGACASLSRPGRGGRRAARSPRRMAGRRAARRAAGPAPRSRWGRPLPAARSG